MTAIAEFTILTPRTLHLLSETVPREKLSPLREAIEGFKPLFLSFLRVDEGDAEEAFILASSKFSYPRLTAVLLLVSIVEPPRLHQLVGAVRNLAWDMLQRNGWRLGGDVQHLRKAWDIYGDVGSIVAQSLEKLSRLTASPYGWLLAATKLDFCLTGTAMYLEDEIADVNPARVGYLCRAAALTAEEFKDLTLRALFPTHYPDDKGKVLARLFGSWGEDDRLEEDLRSLYKSRRYGRPDPV